MKTMMHKINPHRNEKGSAPSLMRLFATVFFTTLIAVSCQQQKIADGVYNATCDSIPPVEVNSIKVNGEETALDSMGIDINKLISLVETEFGDKFMPSTFTFDGNRLITTYVAGNSDTTSITYIGKGQIKTDDDTITFSEENSGAIRMMRYGIPYTLKKMTK